MQPINSINLRSRLTFAELEALTGLGLAGLFTLNHAGVAHEEALFLQSGAILDVVLTQGTGYSHAKSLSLTGDATTVKIGFDVPFTFSIGNLKSLVDNVLQWASGEIFFIVSVVDDNLASASSHIYASNGAFSSTDCVDYFHILYYLTSLILITLGL